LEGWGLRDAWAENGWLVSEGTELELITRRFGRFVCVGPVGEVMEVWLGIDVE